MMGIFDKLTGRHKDAEQEEDPNLQQQGGQQGYETSQDMGTAQSNIGQQPQGGYDDPDMNMGDQDPDMSMGDQNPDMSMGDQNPNMNMGDQNPDMNMGDQNPNMNMGDQDPDEDPDMGDEQPKRGNQGW
jgi:hypothetical protein